MQKLKIKILYYQRITVKLLCFALFGAGSFFLASVFFPIIIAFTFLSPLRFQKIARKSVSVTFALFIKIMVFFKGITFKVNHRERIENLHSKIIIANHPSLLDVVMLISLIPNADCMVKASLGGKNILRGIVNRLYIPNSLHFEEVIENCIASLDQGNCFIIFPEGTRTRPGKPFHLKKGAARIALAAKKDIIPIYFGGNEKIGLRKYDRLLSFHPTEPYHYILSVLEPISISDYTHFPAPKAAQLLTDQFQEVFTRAKELDTSGFSSKPVTSKNKNH